MGNGGSKQYLRDLPKDTSGLERIEGKELEKALKGYQGIVLSDRDVLGSLSLSKKVIRAGSFRRIKLHDFLEHVPDRQRKILKAFAESPDHPWTPKRIGRHPYQFFTRVERSLILVSFDITAKDAEQIQIILRSNRIRCLELHQCSFKDDALKKILAAAVNVTRLDISETLLTDDQARRVGNFLAKKRLSHIIAHGCNLSSEATNALICKINQRHSVELLDLSGNEIGRETIEFFATFITAKKLVNVVIEDCTIIGENLDQIWKKKRAVSFDKDKVVIRVRSTTIRLLRSDYDKLQKAEQDCHTPQQQMSALQRNTSIEVICEQEVPDNSSSQQSRYKVQSAETRVYDLSIYEGENALLVVIDKDNEASKRLSLPTKCHITPLPVHLGRDKTYQVQISCRGYDVIEAAEQSFRESELHTSSLTMHRFFLNHGSVPRDVQSLMMIVSLQVNGEDRSITQTFGVSYRFKEQDGVTNIFANNNRGNITGGSQAGGAIGCHDAKLETENFQNTNK